MKLLPIDVDESRNRRFVDPECLDVLAALPAFYQKAGFNPPWIGYFVEGENGAIVGMGGYKGKPGNKGVEIAYGTFRDCQKKGIGTLICRELVVLARKTDPTVRITARTLPEYNASTRILIRNGFSHLGTVWDEEDGNVWEWEFQKFPEE